MSIEGEDKYFTTIPKFKNGLPNWNTYEINDLLFAKEYIKGDNSKCTTLNDNKNLLIKEISEQKKLEIKRIADEKKRNKEMVKVRKLSSAYNNYLTVKDFCGENVKNREFKKFKKNAKIVLDKLIEDMKIPKKDIEKVKDKSSSIARSGLDKDQKYQSYQRIISALDENKAYKVCKDLLLRIGATYRMLAKEATKSTEKKKREF